MRLKTFGLILMVLVLCVVVTGCGLTTKTTTNTNKTTTNVNAVTTTNTNAAAITTITTDKTTYKAGETITVTYKIVEPLKDGAWIGIVPSTTKHGLEEDGDAADIDWKYLDGSKAGTKTFTASGLSPAGSYDVRIYDTEFSGGIELGSTTITITQ